MSQRNLKKLGGKFNSNLIGKLWAKINSGDYGATAMPDDSDALTIKGDTAFETEYEDEQSGARTNTRNNFLPIRMKGKSKVAISTFLHVSKDNEKESSIGKYLELLMGKKEVVSATRGASVVIADPISAICGITITTAGSLIGMAGNYCKLILSNQGASGVAAVSISGKEITLNYFNDSTIEDVVLVLDAEADLTAVVDANGDDKTDTLVNLLASRGLESNATLYFSGGAEKGFVYSNETAPRKDMTVIYNKEKTGQVITGVIIEKMSLDITDKIPAVKFEGMARKSVLQGIANLVSQATATKKLYVGSEYKQFASDSSVPSYVDVIAPDGISYLSVANKVVSVGTDLTGNFVEVETNVSAPSNSYVAFHEPANHNPEYSPLNGMNGKAKVDGLEFDEVRSVKMEYANNHQVFDNLALEDTIKGFDPSKVISCKLTFEIQARQSHLPLINKLREKEAVACPVELEVGSGAGSRYVIFARMAHIKAPNLADKADEVQTLTLECEVIVAPETVDQATVIISAC